MEFNSRKCGFFIVNWFKFCNFTSMKNGMDIILVDFSGVYDFSRLHRGGRLCMLIAGG